MFHYQKWNWHPPGFPLSSRSPTNKESMLGGKKSFLKIIRELSVLFTRWKIRRCGWSVLERASHNWQDRVFNFSSPRTKIWRPSTVQKSPSICGPSRSASWILSFLKECVGKMIVPRQNKKSVVLWILKQCFRQSLFAVTSRSPCIMMIIWLERLPGLLFGSPFLLR